jgi:hypothetical protein
MANRSSLDKKDKKDAKVYSSEEDRVRKSVFADLEWLRVLLIKQNEADSLFHHLSLQNIRIPWHDFHDDD